MKVTTKITGTDAIARKLKAMGGALQRKTLVPIMTDALEPMADDMRANAARDKGTMADSVTVSTELSPAQRAANVPIAPIEVYAGPGPLPQAIAKEFGNFRQAPDPFIRPAYDAHGKQALRQIGERGIDAILDAGRKG